MNWTSFILGTFVGAAFGLLTAALCFAAADRTEP
jgi:predicted outer membrane lipoprotein